jgi:hypothetical protein
MNDELLAASSLLVQSGALMVSHNSLSTFLQLSKVKPQNQLRPLLRPRFNQMAKRARRVS